MLHGPCGAANHTCVCMDKDTASCTKHFPKDKMDRTSTEENAYPLYRRRCLQSYKKYDSKGRVVFDFDDSWVVPYNPYLIYKHDTHINFEICNSVMSVKYMYKYVYKGHDMASVALVRIPLENNNAGILDTAPRIIDEIQQYADSRYVGASEAAFSLLG